MNFCAYYFRKNILNFYFLFILGPVFKKKKKKKKIPIHLDEEI